MTKVRRQSLRSQETMSRTHYDVMRDVGEDWNFRKEFIRALTIAEAERREYTFFHMMAGKMPEKTGRYFCELCDGYLHEEACSDYEEWIRDIFKRDIIDPFIQQTCPECHTPIEEKQLTRVVEGEVGFFDTGEDPEPVMAEIEMKTKYDPCGCLHERGEEKIRWDIDKQAIRNAADRGELGTRITFDGRVFKREDGLTDFERRMKENGNLH